MGVSIFAGAVTTLLSASALWFTMSLFFAKFAYLVTVTILSAFLWSIFFFTAFCMTFGPEVIYMFIFEPLSVEIIIFFPSGDHHIYVIT